MDYVSAGTISRSSPPQICSLPSCIQFRGWWLGTLYHLIILSIYTGIASLV